MTVRLRILACLCLAAAASAGCQQPLTMRDRGGYFGPHVAGMTGGEQAADPFQAASGQPGTHTSRHPAVGSRTQTADSGNTGIVIAGDGQPAATAADQPAPFVAGGWQTAKPHSANGGTIATPSF